VAVDRRQVRIVRKRDRTLAAAGEVIGAGERERDAVLAVAADQRQLRARGLCGAAEEQRAAPGLRRIRRALRTDARFDVEVLRDDDARAADLAKLEVRRHRRTALAARRSAGRSLRDAAI